MSTRPSIPVVVTRPERRCSRCGAYLMMHAPACPLCGTEAPAEPARPVELSVAAQLAAFRAQLEAEGRCGPRKPEPRPETQEQKRARWMRGDDIGEALYPPSDNTDAEV